MRRSLASLVLLTVGLLLPSHSLGGDEACTDPPGGPECEMPCAAAFACDADADCDEGYVCAQCDVATLLHCTSSNCFCDEQGWVCSGDLSSECVLAVPASSSQTTFVLFLGLLLLVSAVAVTRRMQRRRGTAL